MKEKQEHVFEDEEKLTQKDVSKNTKDTFMSIDFRMRNTFSLCLISNHTWNPHDGNIRADVVWGREVYTWRKVRA